MESARSLGASIDLSVNICIEMATQQLITLDKNRIEMAFDLNWGAIRLICVYDWSDFSLSPRHMVNSVIESLINSKTINTTVFIAI